MALVPNGVQRHATNAALLGYGVNTVRNLANHALQQRYGAGGARGLQQAGRELLDTIRQNNRDRVLEVHRDGIQEIGEGDDMDNTQTEDMDTCAANGGKAGAGGGAGASTQLPIDQETPMQLRGGHAISVIKEGGSIYFNKDLTYFAQEWMLPLLFLLRVKVKWDQTFKSGIFDLWRLGETKMRFFNIVPFSQGIGAEGMLIATANQKASNAMLEFTSKTCGTHTAGLMKKDGNQMVFDFGKFMTKVADKPYWDLKPGLASKDTNCLVHDKDMTPYNDMLLASQTSIAEQTKEYTFRQQNFSNGINLCTNAHAFAVANNQVPRVRDRNHLAYLPNDAPFEITIPGTPWQPFKAYWVHQKGTYGQPGYECYMDLNEANPSGFTTSQHKPYQLVEVWKAGAKVAIVGIDWPASLNPVVDTAHNYTTTPGMRGPSNRSYHAYGCANREQPDGSSIPEFCTAEFNQSTTIEFTTKESHQQLDQQVPAGQTTVGKNNNYNISILPLRYYGADAANLQIDMIF